LIPITESEIEKPSFIGCWAHIFKRLRSPGIDFKELIPSAYVAWRPGTINLSVVLVHAQIRAQDGKEYNFAIQYNKSIW